MSCRNMGVLELHRGTEAAPERQFKNRDWEKCMNRLSFNISRMRYVIGTVCVYLLVFALSGGNAWNWQAAAYSLMPISLALTSFLHFGFLHLLSNVYGLLVFGWVLCNCLSERKAKGPILPLLFILASLVTGVVPYYLQPQAYHGWRERYRIRFGSLCVCDGFCRRQ